MCPLKAEENDITVMGVCAEDWPDFCVFLIAVAQTEIMPMDQIFMQVSTV